MRFRLGLCAFTFFVVVADATSPGWVRDWHVAERHQYIVTLSGKGEIELVGGRKIALEPGSVILEEDSSGKGHISRTIGTEDRIALNIQLADH
jgi:hypothetical protein